MPASSSLFSILFLMVCISSILLGVNVLIADGKKSLNRLFFLMALMLSIWSFGFAIALDAPTSAICLLWRRVAAFGWTTVYSLSVHFTLVFCGFSPRPKRRWLVGLLYVPAVALAYVFSLSDAMSVHQYQLVRIGSGWVNTQVTNGWDVLFYAYFAIYSFAALALLFRKYRTSDGQEKRQALLLLLSFGTAIVLGTLTDLINSTFQWIDMPQMAPVALLIPTIAIHFSMSRHNLMVKQAGSEQAIILSKDLRNRLFLYFSIVPAGAGVVLFVSQFVFAARPLTMVLLPTLCYIMIGVIGLLAYRLGKGRRFLETMFSLAAIIMIPITELLVLADAGVSARAVPFIFIVVSMLFNDRKLLIYTSMSTLLTMATLWIKAPVVNVHVDSSDYLAYTYLLLVSIWVAFFVSKTYVSRLAETVMKNRLQVLISGVSKLLLSVSRRNRDEHFDQVVQKIGQTYKADLVFLCFRGLTLKEDVHSYSWKHKTGIADLINAQVRQEIFEFLRVRPLVIPNAATDSGLAADVKEMLERIGLRSVLSIPLDFSDAVAGYLAVGTVEPRQWNPNEKESLDILVNTISDSITKLSAEQEIEFLAYHDHLTRLPNQLLFNDRVEQAIRLAERTCRQFGVIFLDLDSFKSINDSLGHKAGDSLICNVAARLSSCLRKSDTIARFGGDEFLLLLQNIESQRDFSVVLKKIMGVFEQPIPLLNREIFITASAGIAIYPQDGETTEELIKNADIAMYSAKDNGKSRFHFCSQDMKEDMQYKARLTNHLYRALERKEFSLVYQPQIDLQTNRLVGMEALLRWNQPEMGSVSPGVFIPLAEKTGVINAIGEWVLVEACQQLKNWQDQGLPRVRMAVNISVHQLRNPRLIDQVKNTLQRTGLDSSYLELEVTESVAMQEPASIVNLMRRFKELGILLSIDDFGTEYSSLSRLKQLPVDRIKLDMQFVQGIDKDEKDRVISKTIINLAKSMELRVIAEGVENSEQLDYLKQEKCDEVQGFYFYRPLPANEMEQVLRNELIRPEPLS